MKKLIFTDLDGTLLDLESYSPDKAREAVRRLKMVGAAIIFCSSKTWSEQESYLRDLSLEEPVITENGSGIFLPKHSQLQFDHEISNLNGKSVVALGKNYEEILSDIKGALAKLALDFKFYFNQSTDQLSQLTGLATEAAKRAKDRSFSETLFNANSDPQGFKVLETELKKKELQCTPGSKFVTITGNKSDKGVAVQMLIKAYKKLYTEVVSYGIGDSQNDLEMLQMVDHPYLVRKPDQTWANMDVPNLSKIAAIGPEGWNLMAEEVLSP